MTVIKRRTSSWRFVASQALIVLTAWLAVAPVMHGAGHDADCDVAVFVHDSSQHRIGNTRANANEPLSEHCVACHFFRLSRHTAAWRFVPQTLNHEGQQSQTNRTFVTTFAVLQIPARAPPALV